MPNFSASFHRFLRGRMLPVAAILLFIVSVGAGLYLHNYTLVGRWQPVGIGVLLALVLLLPARSVWRRVAGEPLDRFGTVCCAVFLSGLCYLAVLSVNSLGLDPASAYETELMVVNKYEKRHTSRRHHSTIRQTHITRHLVVRDASGADYELEVPSDRYMRTALNRPVKVRVNDGRLGFRVIDLL